MSTRAGLDRLIVLWIALAGCRSGTVPDVPRPEPVDARTPGPDGRAEGPDAPAPEADARAPAPDAGPSEPAGRAPMLAIPEAVPLATMPLGVEAWRTLAVSPAHDVLAVATAEQVILRL